MSNPSRSYYGWRAKLGLIVPQTNTVNEAEWGRVLPDGVTFHTARMPLHHDDGPEAFAGLVDELAAKVRELTSAEVGVVAYACTAETMVVPAHKLPEAATAATGTPVVTTAEAIVAALRALKATRISIATPYAATLSARESAFFVAAGLEVLDVHGLGIEFKDHMRVPKISLAVVEKLAREACVAGSDALFITCTDLPCLPLIESLEAALSVPVVTSNQATLWRTLRAAGVDVRLPKLGRLFAHSETVPA